MLVRKLKRLQMETQPPRAVDWSDCIAITRRIMNETSVPVTKRDLRTFDDTIREPPVFDTTIGLINQHFRELFGYDGFVD